jgi:hypothetical protein
MGDVEALSTNELIEVRCRALGKKAHFWNIPRGLMNGFAKIGDVHHLPLNTQGMQKLTENYVVSNVFDCCTGGADGAYVVFMKKYYHLHEEYLASLKK